MSDRGVFDARPTAAIYADAQGLTRELVIEMVTAENVRFLLSLNHGGVPYDPAYAARVLFATYGPRIVDEAARGVAAAMYAHESRMDEHRRRAAAR